jgi:hypothetical protein
LITLLLFLDNLLFLYFMTYQIWGDSELESDWFARLTPALSSAKILQIKRRGQNPQHIEELVMYDRPDIILCSNDKPILVLEKTREVPTGHNGGQRLGRIIRSLECNVPTITLLPFRARKHGTHTNICEINARLLRAAEIMTNIHNTPCMFLNWTTNTHGELIGDGGTAKHLVLLIDQVLNGPLSINNPHVKNAFLDANNAALNCEKKHPQYLLPPRSVSIVPSISCTYTIGMTEENCRREDPYTGMQFLYDYLYCRSGPTPIHKHTKLILNFPNISYQTFQSNNPNCPSRKSSLWYATANELVFNDKQIVLR